MLELIESLIPTFCRRLWLLDQDRLKLLAILHDFQCVNLSASNRQQWSAAGLCHALKESPKCQLLDNSAMTWN